MSTHAFIPDPDIVQGLHPANLTGDTLIFYVIVIFLLILLYLVHKGIFTLHHH